MLRRILSVGQKNGQQWMRWTSQQATARKENWDVMAGVLIERLPEIIRDQTPLEKEYAKMLSDIEFENSMKSDHEIRHERDMLMVEKLKKGDMELDLEETVKQTAQDLEDAYGEELKKFQVAPRITEADKKNDKKSTKRKLDQGLVLLLEQQIGNKKYFLFPQGAVNAGETLRDTAERVIKEKCGPAMSVQVYGNCPVGFYKYKYPSEQRTNAVGAKIFFYRAVLNTVPELKPDVTTFEWLTKEEMQDRLPAEYFKSVHPFVL